jgi:Rrf2 family protein
MIGLSLTTGYAIQALSCLNDSTCACRQVADVACCSGVPKAYLAKILNLLSHHGLLTAKRGYRGGVTLARKPGDISLLEIVEAIEDSRWIADCLLHMTDCSGRSFCPTHNFWKRIRREITTELQNTTLADVIFTKQSRPAAQRTTKTTP